MAPVRALIHLLLVAAALAPLAGCKRIVSALVQQGQAETVKAPTITQPSQEAARAFADELVEALRSSDKTRVVRMHDVDTNMLLGIVGLSVPPAFLKGVKDGARSVHESGGALVQVADGVKQGGTVDLLRLETDAAGRWARLRYIAPEGGFDHLRLLLDQRADGVYAVDIDQLSTGRRASETMREMLVPLVPTSFIERLGGNERVEAEKAQKMGKVAQHVRARERLEAIAAIDGLPPDIRSSRWAMIMRISAESLDTEQPGYLRALEDFIRSYPDDPVAQIHQLDARVMRKDLEGGAAAAKHLHGLIGPDAYMRVLEGSLLLEAGKPDAARVALVQGMTEEPKLQSLHSAMVDVALAQKDFGQVRDSLLFLESEHGLRFDLASEPLFGPFLKSEEYPEYRAKSVSEP